MRALFSDRRFKLLTLACGGFQLGHLAMNTMWLLGFLPIGFPPPPPHGWQDQTQTVFIGIAVTDSLGAIVSLCFVVGYLLKKRWAFCVGLLPLAGYVFNQIEYVVFAVCSGAWRNHPLENVGILMVASPLFAIFAWLALLFSRLPDEPVSTVAITATTRRRGMRA